LLFLGSVRSRVVAEEDEPRLLMSVKLDPGFQNEYGVQLVGGFSALSPEHAGYS